MGILKLRSRRDNERRSRFEVFATKNIQGVSFHNKLSNARKAKLLLKKKGGKGIVIYDIKKDKPYKKSKRRKTK